MKCYKITIKIIRKRINWVKAVLCCSKYGIFYPEKLLIIQKKC